jgi:hypothetical protein
MHPHAQRLVLRAAALLAAASVVVVPRNFVAADGNPHGAYYSADTNRVLWFIHVSDTHIGARGTTDADRLRWLVTTGKSVINPSFIVATGDLTDSTNGNILGYPNGPYQTEWNEYKSIVDPNVGADFYYDIPGNHDAYNDATFAYYRANSVQGRATSSTQVAWTRTLATGETYRFLGVNTADNSGAPFSISFPYGDHAGLDSGELAFIEQELAKPASLALVFGHHPVTDTGVSGDTWLFYGHQDFVHHLDVHSASVYGYGHTHAYSQVLFKGNDYTGYVSGDGLAYNNITSLGKSSSNNYSIVAIDCNGVSAVPATTGTWPVVLITAPLNAYAGAEPNPYAYTVPAAADNPIRALVFDVATNPEVTYRIDAGTTWYPMTRVADGPLWQATWNASALPAGDHTIEVRAVGTSTRSQVIAVAVSQAAGAAAGDVDGDGRSDLVWHHSTLGEVWLWPMNGAARTAETHVRTVGDTNWEIRGLGDQTGDGKADILWRNKTTGEIYLWPMNGSAPLAETYVATVDPAYDIVGTGDFNGDGRSDILWRHLTTGEVWLWLMDGATPLSRVYVDTVDPAYVVKGVGDFDGDGKADIVWHHATAGEVWVWLMDGTTRRSATWVATVPDVGYQIQGVADHDGNGKADILWRHATTGDVWIWRMDGATRLAETWVGTVPDTGYRVVGSGDYNGDGKSDILWHHATAGEVWVWLMDGATRLSETWVATVPEIGYQIVK